MNRETGRATGERRHVFLTLDAMRGIAAIAVVIYHARGAIPLAAFPGYLAVDFFFILSGFVIAHAYDNRLRAGMTAVQFTTARVIRLYPMFIVGALMGSALAALSWPHANGANLSSARIAVATVCSILFLPNPVTTSLFLTGPLWSLFFEMVANVAYALSHPFIRVGHLLLVSGICLAGLIVTAIWKGQIDFGSLLREVPWGILRVGYGFCAGASIYRLRARLPSVTRVVPAWSVAVATGAFLLLPIPPDLNAVYSLIFVSIIAPLLVIVGFQVEPGPRQAGTFRWLGVVSYPIYTIHRPALRLTLAAAAFGVSASAIALATIGGLLVLCPLLVRYYDTPVRAWLSRLAHQWLRPPELQAAP